ncbi:hypothetical protein EDD22DRAFT_854567 [Suillus occidentalis]|nr:hypothetical protein EDD22DRAFT_854567 [Suillus occidentalis]
MSSEAVAQAVLTKEADLEWKHLRTLASTWEIEDKAACLASASKEPMVVSFEALANCSMEELKTCIAFSIAAYGQDRMSFIATDAQLDYLKGLAREHYLPLSDEDALEEVVGACEQDSQASGEESPKSVMVLDEDYVSQSGSDLPVCGSTQNSTKSHD